MRTEKLRRRLILVRRASYCTTITDGLLVLLRNASPDALYEADAIFIVTYLLREARCAVQHYISAFFGRLRLFVSVHLAGWAPSLRKA